MLSTLCNVYDLKENLEMKSQSKCLELFSFFPDLHTSNSIENVLPYFATVLVGEPPNPLPLSQTVVP